jgi:hypothetical protein
MNNETALALFHKYDDPIQWEYPIGFDYNTAVSRFRHFAAQLDTLTAVPHKIETGSLIQDASFHSQIDLGAGWLRFSNFGNMVSITPDHQINDITISLVAKLCQENEYLFVPTEVAETPYTGKNPGVTGISSWWIRYFDWV